jgi:hypothetical protein
MITAFDCVGEYAICAFPRESLVRLVSQPRHDSGSLGFASVFIDLIEVHHAASRGIAVLQNPHSALMRPTYQ